MKPKTPHWNHSQMVHNISLPARTSDLRDFPRFQKHVTRDTLKKGKSIWRQSLISHEHARERESIDSNIFPRCFPKFPSDFMTPLPLLQGADGSSKATPLQKRGWITWSLFQAFGIFGYISPPPQLTLFMLWGRKIMGPMWGKQIRLVCNGLHLGWLEGRH